VVALDHERSERVLVVEGGRARRAADLGVFVNREAVEHDLGEAGVPDLLPGGIETRRLELDAQPLPEPGRPAGVGPGGVAVVTFLALAAGGVPALVDAAVVAGSGITFAPAVEELHFVSTLQIHPGI
jgi:hypothetical protein